MSDLLDALGVDINAKKDEGGYYGIQTLTRAINSLKPLTNEAARTIAYQANLALDKAMAIAGSTIFNVTTNEIFLNKVRKDVNDVRGHLKWHTDRIPSEPDKIYGSADDLKKYVLMAFYVYNETVEGVKTDKNNTAKRAVNEVLDDSNAFFKNVIAVVVKLYQKTEEVVRQGVSYLKWGLGIAAVAAVGYGWYQLKMAKYKYGSLRSHETPPELEG